MKRVNIDEMQDIVKARQEQYKVCRRGALIMVGLLIAGIVFLLMHQYCFTYIALAVAVLFHLCFLRKKQKEYVQAVNESNILLTVGRRIGAERVERKEDKESAANIVEEAQLIPVDEKSHSVSFFNSIQGEYRDMKIAVSDAVVMEPYAFGRKNKKRYVDNCGCWTHIELKEETSYDFRLFEENALPAMIQQPFYDDPKQHNLRKRMAMSVGLSADCYFYTATDFIPGDRFFLRFQDLKRYTPGGVAISVRGKTIDVYIRNRVLARAVSMREQPTQESLCFDPYPELKWILELADYL